MLYLAIIFHMHQPYYKNLLTQETSVPWVRLHGIKDYLDMVQVLEKYPTVRQVFNLVPSLLEQIEDYVNGTVKDKYLELSYKNAADLTSQEKKFLLDNFFHINLEKVIAIHPRYYELYLKRQARKEFSSQDYLDLQVWFNLAWFDPYFRQTIPELKVLEEKGRFFNEEEKLKSLDMQKDVLKQVIPIYQKFIASNQIEVTPSPYYHPILPLLYHTNTAKEANIKTTLPKNSFGFPEDAKAQVDLAVKFHQERFGAAPKGMWPSEESVSEHILPYIIQSGINWIVTDEAILFKSLKKRKRETGILYRPYLAKRKDGALNIIFRDRNLSDLISFVYHKWKTQEAVADLMLHLKNIADASKDKDILVTIAMDGENAWEYYSNDGHDFLELWYQKLSEAQFLKSTTISAYLESHPAKNEIKRLSPGSWIYADFMKWIGDTYKNRAWEYLAEARKELAQIIAAGGEVPQLAWKQIYVAEGSDWFWWYRENHSDFDQLFRMHLSNFYTLINKPVPEYLKTPLE